MVKVICTARRWRLAAAAVVALGLTLPAVSPTWAVVTSNEASALSPAAEVLAGKIADAQSREDVIAALVESQLSKAEVAAALAAAAGALAQADRSFDDREKELTNRIADDQNELRRQEGNPGLQAEIQGWLVMSESELVEVREAKAASAARRAALLTFVNEVIAQVKSDGGASTAVITFVDNSKKEDGSQTKSQATGAISNPATQTLAQGTTTTIYVG